MDEGPLDQEIAALLRREGARIDAPADAQARVLARLNAALPGPGPGGGGGGSGATWGVAKLAALAAALAVVGVVVLRARDAAPAAPIEAAAIPSAPALDTPAADASAAPTPLRVGSAASADIPSVDVASLPTVAVAAPTDDLAAERRILDRAREALAGGSASESLTRLLEHERAFPAGRLAEEREALFVRALADQGAGAAARQRADRFRAKWPNSLLLPVVEGASPTPP